MSDLPNREFPGAQIDLSRLGHPHTDAFRHIAEALGARYAGDEPVSVPPDGAPVAALDLPAEAPPQDPRAAALLETLPLPVLVTNANRIAYLNRRAKAVLGYAGAEALEAAGGLAALFGERKAMDGTLAIADALGKVFRATVEMTPIDWAGRRAVMLSMQPVASEARPLIGAEALSGLIDANPDPIAVVTRGGRVEAANAAYAALADGTGEDIRLEQRLEAEALDRVLRLTAEAFGSPDGAAALASPMRIGTRAMTVSAGILRGTELACLVFHPEDERETAPASPSPAPAAANALERAAATAGGLIEDDAVRITVSGGPASSLERALDEESERFFRALLVAIGGRAPAGSTVAVERRGGHYGLTLDPASAGVSEAVAASARLILLGLEAGLALAPAGDGELTIAPVLASTADAPA